jgi:hypothetical protein
MLLNNAAGIVNSIATLRRYNCSGDLSRRKTPPLLLLREKVRDNCSGKMGSCGILMMPASGTAVQNGEQDAVLFSAC